VNPREIKEILNKAGQSIEGAQALLEKKLPHFAALGQHFVKTRLLDSKFHEYLIRASEIRQIGDYEFGNEISSEEAGVQIERAKEFLEATKKSLKRK